MSHTFATFLGHWANWHLSKDLLLVFFLIPHSKRGQRERERERDVDIHQKKEKAKRHKSYFLFIQLECWVNLVLWHSHGTHLTWIKDTLRIRHLDRVDLWLEKQRTKMQKKNPNNKSQLSLWFYVILCLILKCHNVTLRFTCGIFFLKKIQI